MYYLAAFKKTWVSFRPLLHRCETTSDEAKGASELKAVVWSVPFVFYVPSGFITSYLWFTQMQLLNKELLNQDWHFSNVWGIAQREVVDMRWRYTGGNSSLSAIRQDITLNFQSGTLTSHSVLSEISKQSVEDLASPLLFVLFFSYQFLINLLFW